MAVSYATYGYGVYGSANGSSGTGVYGNAYLYGVYGYAYSTDGIGVVGMQSGYSTDDLGTFWKPGGFFGGRNGVVGITKR